MDLGERKRAQELFAREARVLVSTDAGGEGLNLQFCHVVVNFDMPWNPMRIEQRIGPHVRASESRATISQASRLYQGIERKAPRDPDRSPK
jgi:superfamily II DNA/RNA helicase